MLNILAPHQIKERRFYPTRPYGDEARDEPGCAKAVDYARLRVHSLTTGPHFLGLSTRLILNLSYWDLALD